MLGSAARKGSRLPSDGNTLPCNKAEAKSATRILLLFIGKAWDGSSHRWGPKLGETQHMTWSPSESYQGGGSASGFEKVQSGVACDTSHRASTPVTPHMYGLFPVIISLYTTNSGASLATADDG